MADFQQAIKWLKEGKKVRRKDWGNKTLYAEGDRFVNFTDQTGDCSGYFFHEIRNIEANDWEIYEERYYECPNCKKKLDKSFMGKQCGCGHWTYHHTCFKEGKKEIKKESLSDNIERIEFPNGVFHEVCYTDAIKEKVQNAQRRLKEAFPEVINIEELMTSLHPPVMIDAIFKEEFGGKFL